jgi:hypothetical protein
LHPEEGFRLVDDLEAAELESPGQVDVLRGHVRRKAADGDHRPPVEQRTGWRRHDGPRWRCRRWIPTVEGPDGLYAGCGC